MRATLLLRVRRADAFPPVCVGLGLPSCSDTHAVELALLDLEKEHLNVPADPQHACRCTIDAKLFLEYTRYLTQISDSVMIQTEKHSLVFAAKGDQLAVKRKLHLSKSDYTFSENVEQEFASRYLSLFGRAANVSDKVMLGISNGIPLMVSFTLPQKLESHSAGRPSTLTFHLAPKVDDAA
eukprot:GHVT01028316.1.p1 GENE.GHVT01028316.1~~GHVT01028316.1.p1  ORF type:complete len:181 (-),score=37.64 GHVT01028316.1:1776-2318(-)